MKTTTLFLSFVFQKLLFSLAKYAVREDRRPVPGTPRPGGGAPAILEGFLKQNISWNFPVSFLGIRSPVL